MDARIRHRRHRVARERGRRRALLLVAVATTCLVGVGAYLLWTSHAFAVRQVVLPTTRHVTVEQMQRAVAPAAGVNLLHVPVDDLQGRLSAIPYVRRARVYRRFPDTLEVRIEEYAPRALVRARDGRRWIVADDGRVLQAAGESAVDLPLMVPQGEVWPQAGGVVDPAVVSALPLLSLLEDRGRWPASHPVGKIQIAVSGDVTIVLAGGAEVRLGEPSQLDEKLTVALAIIDQYLREGRAIAYVDVGEPSRAVARAR